MWSSTAAAIVWVGSSSILSDLGATAVADLIGTCVNEDGSTYSLLPPVPTIPQGPMILFTGDGWSTADQAQIISGAQIAGNALAETLNATHPHWNLTGQEAFMLVYKGPVTFHYAGIACVDDPRNSLGVCGARTEGRNLITVYTDADIITNKSHWARHELGHAFVSAVGSSLPISMLRDATANDPQLGREARNGYYGFASDQSSPRLWQQSVGNAGTAYTEIWADMYLGWTSSTWQTNTDGSFTAAGAARDNFMNSTMPLLVNLSIGQ